WWMWILVWLSTLACVGIPIKIWNNTRVEMLLEDQKATAMQARFDALRRQINPHFLFNTLNAATSCIWEQPEKTRWILVKLSSILRRLLKQGDDFVPLSREMEFIEDYLSLEEARFGKENIRIEKRIDPRAMDVPVPVMILQPLVENAVRHGISPKVGGGTVRISAEREGSRLRLVVRDDGVEVAGDAADGEEAARLVRQLRPDLLLLDIQMPGLDGFGVLERIGDVESPPAVVFVTAYDEYAVRAFEVNAVDYLLKPIDEERLAEAVERASRIARGLEARPDIEELLSTIDAAPRRFALRGADRLVMVDLDDILYATVEDGDVVVVTAEVSGVVSCRSLEEFLSWLPPARFVRVHRSFVANLGAIREIVPWTNGSSRLRMGAADGPVIPLSRAHTRELRRRLNW
ncbi:MAG TPA: response regulator, partial [Alphaproteobacteria bacterium]|nr:response regulator [Alphaproteobacteria bacterium]